MSPSLPRQAGARRRYALALLVPLALASLGAHARADVCSSCPAPGVDDLAARPGFSLDTRSDFWGNTATDTLHTDGGECAYALVADPVVTTGKTWTVARGSGVVFNCPWGKSSGNITYSVADGDSTEWKAEAELGLELSLAVAKVSASVGAALGGGTTHGETLTVSQTLEATFGHVLDWTGYFRLADLTLDADFSVTRRYAWWTKNQLTGDQVHQKGDIAMACGTEHVTLTRRASIAWEIGIIKSTCDGTGTPIDLGTFPRPPNPPPPAITPPENGLPSPPAPYPPELDDPAPGEEPLLPDDGPWPVTDEPADPFAPQPTPTPGYPRSSGELPVAPTGPLLDFPTGDPSEGLDR